MVAVVELGDYFSYLSHPCSRQVDTACRERRTDDAFQNTHTDSITLFDKSVVTTCDDYASVFLLTLLLTYVALQTFSISQQQR